MTQVHGARPLDGIKVLDFTRWLAGPFATSTLGDMGADVIKVERGTGDNTRDVDELYAPHMSSYFLGLNRSKRSILVDYRTPAGRDLMLRMAESVDVVVENFRPGVMEHFGLDYEAMRERNERLVYCSISSFGADGPLRGKAGMDLVVQAMGGVMGLTGEPDGVPMRSGAPIADFVGAFHTVYAVSLGLLARERTGQGQRVDVPLINGQFTMLANYLAGFMKTGEPSKAVGVIHPQLAPYQLFETADRYLVIACLTEEFWRGLCRALNLEYLIDDPRFAQVSNRVEHRDDLIPMIEEITKQRTSQDLSALLDEFDVPNAPVNGLADVVDLPQINHNDMVIELDQRSVGTYRAVGVPVRFSETPGYAHRPAPELGEHTDEVLEEFGIDVAEVEWLRTEGALGPDSNSASAG
jgi:formyl-CoA transferase/CoA:oxalate CoA-transferase